MDQDRLIKIADFLNQHALPLLWILLGAVLVRYLGIMIVERLVRNTLKAHRNLTERDRKQRGDTVISLVRTTTQVLIWLITGILILWQLDIQLGALLAGAGFVGVALGFGAQSLIKDFLSGLFIIMENWYRVGDVVDIGTVSGTVEAITMRTTVLRDMFGNLHHVPNGSITLASNRTMGFSRVNIDIPINYESDLDEVEQIVNKIGQDMAKSETWGSKIIDPPAFSRVRDFTNNAVIIKIIGKTQPTQQWKVGSEFRRRIIKAFDKEGIIISPDKRHNERKKRKP